MHILDPNGDPTILPRILTEVNAAKRSDGSFDIAILMTSPLLQSMFHEVLRLHVDSFVIRDVVTSINLPLSPHGPSAQFEPGSILLAPTHLTHCDETHFSNPPAREFCADRFIAADEKTGARAFSSGSSAGRMFPFGGGGDMCPGRAFAKQEVIAATALMLASFDFEVLGFVDRNGRAMERIPSMEKVAPGSGVIRPGGDLRLKVRRKRSTG
jgi:cytochrome P450